MFESLHFVLSPLFAEPSPPAGGGGDGFMFIMMMMPILLIFYWFFMLRPAQRQEEAQRRLIDSLQKNDKVLTVGGLIGVIHSVDKEKNEVVLKVDDANNVKVKFFITSVQAVFPKDDAK